MSPTQQSSMRLVPLLALGQIFGWGTTYYMPSVLAPALSRDLGLDPTGIYLGVTIMVAIGGLAAPTAGRLIDTHGAARFMPVAPAAIGLGHLLVAAVPSATTWYVAWVLHGIAMPLGLTLAATTFLTRRGAADARRTIGIMTLLVGFAPSAFWPLTALLEAAFDWRGTLLVYGAIELLVLLPLQIWIGRRWTDREPETSAPDPRAPSTEDAAADAPPPVLTGTTRAIAITAMVIAFTAQGFASWGLPLHVIRLFEDLGLDHGTAVTVAAASGAATIGARTLEVAFGHRLHPLTTTGLAITVLTPMLALLGSPLDPLTSAWIFIVVWSGANGILAVLRMTLPLSLFGANAYGTLVGRMSLPQNLAFSAAPAVFAVVIDRGGPTAALWLAIAASLTALVAAVVLARIARPPEVAAPH